MTRYEFALLRYVHDPVGGEFANIGVVAFIPQSRRLLFELTERYKRFSEFFGDLDGTAFRSFVRGIEAAFRDLDHQFEQPELDGAAPSHLAEILNTILSDDGSAIQASEVMGGVHAQVEERVAEIYQEFVGRYERASSRERRSEEQIGRDLVHRISRAELDRRIQYTYPIRAPHYSYDFRVAWQNGRAQVCEPISFDLERGRSIVDKAVDWSGRLLNLSKGPVDFRFTALLAEPQDRTLRNSFREAVSILNDSPNVRMVVPEGEISEVVRIIREDTQPHEGTPALQS